MSVNQIQKLNKAVTDKLKSLTTINKPLTTEQFVQREKWKSELFFKHYETPSCKNLH
jgi:hypothetical protein